MGKLKRQNQVDASSSSPKASKSKTAKVKVANTSSRLPHYIATFAGVFVAVVAYIMYENWLQTIVTTPLDVPKVVIESGADVPDRYWGTYRPGVFFGVKTRSQESPVFGLMWFRQAIVNNQLPLRHQCLMGGFDQRYNWLEHDGKNYGVQSIFDEGISITNTFVKRPTKHYGGEWTTRFTVKSETTEKLPMISLLFYSALDNDGYLKPNYDTKIMQSVVGNTKATGRFRLSFKPNSTNVYINYLSTYVAGLGRLDESVMRSFSRVEKEKFVYVGLAGEVYPPNVKDQKPNFVVYQVTGNPPFELEVVYESEENDGDRSSVLTGQEYLDTLQDYSLKFHRKFDEVFRLREDTYSRQEIYFAKAALSNLIGGIGYFHGRSVVKSVYNKEPVLYFEAPLYTAVPSRPFFPRGFLWDEGFHTLLIARWDLDIAKDIIAHWLDLMNKEGWIPREQILDEEARVRVPAEFVVQKNSYANPPALFLPLKYMLGKMTEKPITGENRDYLKRVYPRLKRWYQWFNTTQLGKLPGTYRWRGRNTWNLEELNPITLTSGFDDYPRATNPSEDERHVDLRCWMAFAAGVLADMGAAIGETDDRFADTFSYLSNNDYLDELHWSPKLQAYTDYGLHSNKIKLQKPRPVAPGAPPPQNQNPIRTYLEEPTLQFINNFGYISLFPFLLRIVDPSSPKLDKILNDIQNPNLLWTPYGLRSLAKSSFYYQKNNNPNNPPYWRGAIWINVNYLAIEALKYYGNVDGPFRGKAKELYSKLKSNIVANMYKEYTKTGYIWEQYNDVDGSGQRAHPFTGWSALVTLIMSDI